MWQLATILAVYSREGFPGGSVVKNLPDNAGDAGSVPGWGRASGKEMQLTPYSCLGNPEDRGSWGATVHGVAKESRHNLVTKQQQMRHTTQHDHVCQLRGTYETDVHL